MLRLQGALGRAESARSSPSPLAAGAPGQATVEYALLVSMISLTAVGLMLLLKDAVHVLFFRTVSAFGPAAAATAFFNTSP